MSSEHNLPPELTGFETKLRSESLADSRVDRDELMYQSGWAAAESARKTGWLWPTTSGVLAASVLLLAGLLASGEAKTDRIAEVHQVEPPADTPQAEDLPVAPKVELVRESRPLWGSSLQAMRLLDMHREYKQPFSFALGEDDKKINSTTARQLMLEMLGETS